MIPQPPRRKQIAMNETSKEVVQEEVVDEVATSQTSRTIDNDGDEESADNSNADPVASVSSAKKKKSKKAKLKKAFGLGGSEDGVGGGSSSSPNPASKLTPEMVEQLLQMNPSLKSEVAGMDKETAAETLKKLDVADLLTGMVSLVKVLFHH